ncbi:MAG: hypothetical protein KIS73_24965 [Enhydrobacter sp.]|nr:hypothetical protein [Enhydrobacter sp.]
MKIFSTVLNFLPPWVPFAVMGALLVTVGGLLWAWGNAREEAGAAKISAAINAASLKTLTEQLDRNQAIAERLDKITGQRAETIRETIREVHFLPATSICRDARAMRALDGRLQYSPGRDGGGAPTARPPPAAVPTSGR